MRSRRTLLHAVALLAVAGLATAARPFEKHIEILSYNWATSQQATWKLFVRDGAATGLLPGRYQLQLTETQTPAPAAVATPPFLRQMMRDKTSARGATWAFKSVSSLDSGIAVYPAHLAGCGAASSNDSGADAGQPVLAFTASSAGSILIELSSRTDPRCKLVATIPAVRRSAGKAAVSPTGGVGPSGSATNSLAATEPKATVDIGDPGRTGLAPGRYDVRLVGAVDNSASLRRIPGRTRYLWVVLKRGSDPPLSYAAQLSGCPADPAEAGKRLIDCEGYAVMANGSLRVELVSRTTPGCRAVASIPALPVSRR